MKKMNEKDVFSLLYKCMEEKKSKNISFLIEEYSDKAVFNHDISFKTGMIGVGWLISFFHRNNILDLDIEEVLYDIDDLTYKLAINQISSKEFNFKELLFLITYFQERVQNDHNNKFYRSFSLKETLKLLVNKANQVTLGGFLSPLENTCILLKYSYLSSLCIDEKEIEKVYYLKMEEILSQYKKLSVLSKDLVKRLCILCISSAQFGNQFWVRAFNELFTQNASDYFEEVKVLREIYCHIEENNKKTIDLSNFHFNNDYDLLFLLSSNLKKATF